MGVLFKLFFYAILFGSTATYYAFSIGPTKLPLAAINAGRSIGMGFNYFKVALRFFTPSSEEANQIVN